MFPRDSPVSPPTKKRTISRRSPHVAHQSLSPLHPPSLTGWTEKMTSHTPHSSSSVFSSLFFSIFSRTSSSVVRLRSSRYLSRSSSSSSFLSHHSLSFVNFLLSWHPFNSRHLNEGKLSSISSSSFIVSSFSSFHFSSLSFSWMVHLLFFFFLLDGSTHALADLLPSSQSTSSGVHTPHVLREQSKSLSSPLSVYSDSFSESPLSSSFFFPPPISSFSSPRSSPFSNDEFSSSQQADESIHLHRLTGDRFSSIISPLRLPPGERSKNINQHRRDLLPFHSTFFSHLPDPSAFSYIISSHHPAVHTPAASSSPGIADFSSLLALKEKQEIDAIKGPREILPLLHNDERDEFSPSLLPLLETGENTSKIESRDLLSYQDGRVFFPNSQIFSRGALGDYGRNGALIRDRGEDEKEEEKRGEVIRSSSTSLVQMSGLASLDTRQTRRLLLMAVKGATR
ncbi:hypothetical protein CSUI_006496, partial [Cystoisospora suis]